MQKNEITLEFNVEIIYLFFFFFFVYIFLLFPNPYIDVPLPVSVIFFGGRAYFASSAHTRSMKASLLASLMRAAFTPSLVASSPEVTSALGLVNRSFC